MSILKLAKRVFNISGNTELYAMIDYELSKPMLCHPQMVDSYVKSFMIAPEMRVGESDNSSPAYAVFDGIGVLSISGAMVARDMNVPCGASPLSYAAILDSMDALMSNDSVHTIVARFDTGGGMASQLMDASDAIFNMRGKGKKLYAMIDDSAFSAGYGLASAFDEIWITRSGGVGSVGTVVKVKNESEANKKAGIEYTYVHAGSKKVLGNPNEPLSEEAIAYIQDNVNHLNDMFTNTVARNLGMSQEEVVATEAGTYTGQKAIDIGFAHKMGTYVDLLTHIEGENMSKSKEELTASIAEKEKAMATATAELAADKEELKLLSEGNTDSGESTASTENIIRDDEVDNVETKADNSDLNTDAELAAETKRKNGILAVCDAANVSAVATENFINSGMSATEVGATLAELSANENQSEVDSVVSGVGSSLSQKVDSSWDHVLSK